MGTIRLIHSTRFSPVLLVLAVLGVSYEAHADALEGVIYKETYRGESVFPTSPDIDRFGSGGLDGFTRGGDPLQAVPELNGDTATARVTSVGGFAFPNEVAGAGAVHEGLLDRGEPVSATGQFDGFHVEVSSSGGSFPGAFASGFTSVIFTRDDGYFLSASLFELHDVRGTTVVLTVAEFDGQRLLAAGPTVLPIAIDRVPFETTLEVDPVGRTAFARLRVAGAAFETPPIPLSAFDGRLPHGLSQLVGVANSSGTFDLGDGDTATAELEGICVSGLRDGGNICRRHGNP